MILVMTEPNHSKDIIESQLPSEPFIGVFDSGVGGLSVLAQLTQKLPNESFLYLGDSVHAPYGDRLPNDLFELTGRICLWFKARGAKAIVAACNTASSTIISELRALVAPLTIYSVLEAGVTGAAKTSKSQNIGVLATVTTTNSRSFETGILSHLPAAKITGVSCPTFVPLVEDNKVSGPEAELSVAEICSRFTDQEMDTVLLGCTHYPALTPLLRKYLPDRIAILDPAAVFAEIIYSDLTRQNLLAAGSKGNSLLITTGDIKQFVDSGTILLGQVPDPVFRLDSSELTDFSPLKTAHGRALAAQIAKSESSGQCKSEPAHRC